MIVSNVFWAPCSHSPRLNYALASFGTRTIRAPRIAVGEGRRGLRIVRLYVASSDRSYSRDHLLKLIHDPLDFLARRDIVLHLVDERRKRYTSRVGGGIFAVNTVKRLSVFLAARFLSPSSNANVLTPRQCSFLCWPCCRGIHQNTICLWAETALCNAQLKVRRAGKELRWWGRL